MKRTLAIGVMLAAILAVATLGFAQTNGAAQPGDADKPALINVNIVKVTAVVVDIDKDNRIITLQGPKGNVLITKAGDEVRNFDQIDKGDEVNVSYYEAVAILVSKGKGEVPQEGSLDVVEVAPKGAKPAGTMVSVQELSASVQKIDYKKRTITLKGPEGNVATFNVDPSVKDFKKVKKGDKITIRHTEALAISVDKPAAK